VPLGHAVAVLERVADGDLDRELDVHTKDEVGRMADGAEPSGGKLNSTLQEVADSAANASSSSQQLAAAAEAIASGAQEQAASLEETSASLEEITAAVRQSADNANQASQLASSSKDSALQGRMWSRTQLPRCRRSTQPRPRFGHHLDHRRDRLPDQSAGGECRGGSGAGGR
jgi:methyl-accepting chemotaxis protein